MENFNCKINENDIATIDLLNAFFICVVLYLHHSMYTKYHIKLFSEFHLNHYLQKMAVGGFFFLSGFKLMKTKFETSFKDFFINRFFRIYLLYLLAVICHSIVVFPYIHLGRFPDYKNIIIHALGIQTILPGIFGPIYLTLWFISFLFLFYLHFIFTRKIVHKTFNYLITLGVTILIIMISHNSIKIFNISPFSKELCIFLLYFSFGMIYAVNKIAIEKIYNFLLILAILFGLYGSLFFLTYKINVWGVEFINIAFYVISSSALYVLIFKIIGQNFIPRRINRTVKYMSYASFCVFLFHRPIWSIMNFVWFATNYFHSLYIMVIIPIIIFIVCYKLQKAYSHSISNFVQAKRPFTASIRGGIQP